VNLLLAMAGWLIAAAVIAVTLGRSIKEMDEREWEHRRRLDEVEQRRRERLRRAIEGGP